MHRSLVASAALLLAHCSPAVPRPVSSSPTPAFHENCPSFESRHVGVFSATGLRGTTVHRDDGHTTPLASVQLAARSSRTGKHSFALSRADGTFEVAPLPSDDYEVSACLNGFDELRFTLVLTPTSHVTHLQVMVGLSEGGGERGVVPVATAQAQGSMDPGRPTRGLTPACSGLATLPADARR